MGEPKAIAELVEAARKIRRVREAQAAYTRELQSLAAEARKTGKSQSHRIPTRVHDYGDGIAALMTALAKYEGSAPPPLQEAPGMKPGQRCTNAVHWASEPHVFVVEDERLWEDEDERIRCPYVAGALQEGPTCGTCGGSGELSKVPGCGGQPFTCNECGGTGRCAPPATERAPTCPGWCGGRHNGVPDASKYWTFRMGLQGDRLYFATPECRNAHECLHPAPKEPR